MYARFRRMSKELATVIGYRRKHGYIGTTLMATQRKGSSVHPEFVALTLFLLFSLFPHVTGNAIRATSFSVNVKSSTELRSLMKKLRSQRARVALTSEIVEQPFFFVPARILNINGVGIQVFQYSSVSAADKDAMLVSVNGMTIGASKPHWMGPPHFYKSGRLIVLYLGSDQRILKVLHSALGKQFAGTD